jgi:hypothetical protein
MPRCYNRERTAARRDAVILRCEPLRASKDDRHGLRPILRDAAKRPLLRMTAEFVITPPYSAACALISLDTCRIARASCSAGCAPDTAYF